MNKYIRLGVLVELVLLPPRSCNQYDEESLKVLQELGLAIVEQNGLVMATEYAHEIYQTILSKSLLPFYFNTSLN